MTASCAVPTKGEVTAWLAAGHRRGAASHIDKINKRVHRRIRSTGGLMCFETLDQEQDGLCLHETILPNELQRVQTHLQKAATA